MRGPVVIDDVVGSTDRLITVSRQHEASSTSTTLVHRLSTPKRSAISRRRFHSRRGLRRTALPIVSPGMDCALQRYTRPRPSPDFRGMRAVYMLQRHGSGNSLRSAGNPRHREQFPCHRSRVKTRGLGRPMSGDRARATRRLQLLGKAFPILGKNGPAETHGEAAGWRDVPQAVCVPETTGAGSRPARSTGGVVSSRRVGPTRIP